jgi:hypothetical protein
MRSSSAVFSTDAGPQYRCAVDADGYASLASSPFWQTSMANKGQSGGTVDLSQIIPAVDRMK